MSAVLVVHDDSDDDPCLVGLCGEVEDCSACEGSGEASDDSGDCYTCHGSGFVDVDHCCLCGGSPYCNCCRTCGAAYIGSCTCPVTVTLHDGTVTVLPPPEVVVPVPAMPVRPRLRLRFETSPRWALVLSDTPRPECPHCRGDGGWGEDRGHPETGEYDGTRDVRCDCWSRFRLPLLAVPQRLVRVWRAVRRLFGHQPPKPEGNVPPF